MPGIDGAADHTVIQPGCLLFHGGCAYFVISASAERIDEYNGHVFQDLTVLTTDGVETVEGICISGIDHLWWPDGEKK